MHGDMEFHFECSAQYLMNEHTKGVRYQVEHGFELNTRREIPYLQATMYYFVSYINRETALETIFKLEQYSTLLLTLKMNSRA